MKYASQILIAVTIVSLFIVTALPTTAFCAEFTADLIRSTEGDADTSKIFIKGKLRREEIMEDGEVHTVTITQIIRVRPYILRKM